MSNTWHICCPGPSFKWEDVDYKEGDTVCAINSALGPVVDAGGPVDYWVCCDSPHPVHYVVQEQAKRHKPVVITSDPSLKWRNDFDLTDVRIVPWPEDHWVRNAAHKQLSMCHAPYWAAEHGATHVKLWGCDMRGTEYVNAQCLDNAFSVRIATRTDVDTGNTDTASFTLSCDHVDTQRERRWIQERACVERLITAAAENGITLERMVAISG